jgi:hypothetical protein
MQYPSFFFVVLINTLSRSNLGKEVGLYRSQSITEGRQDRTLTKNWSRNYAWLVFLAQASCLGNGATHGGLSPLALINTKTIPHRTTWFRWLWDMQNELYELSLSSHKFLVCFLTESLHHTSLVSPSTPRHKGRAHCSSCQSYFFLRQGFM